MNSLKQYLEKNEYIKSYASGNKEMHPDCEAAVVIPAYNEENTITKTLEALENQVKIHCNQIEVIVVVNNTQDKTLEVLQKFINGGTNFNYLVINVDFPPENAGVGAARKLGCDFALYRNFQSTNQKEDFFLIWLDADNWQIPPDYIAETLNVLKSTKADAVAARISFDYEKLSKKHKNVEILHKMKLALQDLLEENGISQNARADADMHTPGAASAFTQKAYLKVGGVPKEKKTSEDTYMGNEIRKYGGKIARVERTIYINARRMLVNPIAWYDNTAWLPENFYSTNELARQGNVSNELPEREKVEELLESRLKSIAKLLVDNDEQKQNEKYVELKKRYGQLFDLNSYYKE